MFRIIIVFVLIILTGCTTPGRTKTNFDEFTGNNQSTVLLGSAKRISKLLGMVQRITVSIMEEKGNNTQYFLITKVYAENDGKTCPHVKENDKVIFLLGNQSHAFKVAQDIQHDNMTGLLAPACEEVIKIGPMSPEFLQDMANQTSVKFKFYNTQHDDTDFQLALELTPKNLRELQKFIYGERKLQKDFNRKNLK